MFGLRKINPSNAWKARWGGVGWAARPHPLERLKQPLTSARCWFEPSPSNFPVESSEGIILLYSLAVQVWSLPAWAAGNEGYLTSGLVFERFAASDAAGLYNEAIFPQVETCVFWERRVGGLFCSICSCLAAFWEKLLNAPLLWAKRSLPESGQGRS